MRTRSIRIVVALGLALAVGGLSAPAAAAKAKPETFVMIIPGFRIFTEPGTLNPEALARVELRPDIGEICVTMRTVEIEPPLTVHLHRGDSTGPIVTTFFEQTADRNPQGCRPVDPAVVEDIQRNGFGYTLDTHAASIPGDGTIAGNVVSGSIDAFLTPEAVVPGPGDPDGTGLISLFTFDKTGEVFVFVNTEGLTPPLTVTLHQADGQPTGPVVATLIEGATHDDPSADLFLERQLVRTWSATQATIT